MTCGTAGVGGTVFLNTKEGATPDLFITKIVTPRFWYWGRRARVTVLVENQGGGDIT